MLMDLLFFGGGGGWGGGERSRICLVRLRVVDIVHVPAGKILLTWKLSCVFPMNVLLWRIGEHKTEHVLRLERMFCDRMTWLDGDGMNDFILWLCLSIEDLCDLMTVAQLGWNCVIVLTVTCQIVRGNVLVTVPILISVPFMICPVSCLFVSSFMNITHFCLPINPAPNECVWVTANQK